MLINNDNTPVEEVTYEVLCTLMACLQVEELCVGVAFTEE
jgi:hypothetical protein